MKKVISILALAAAMTFSASAQSLLGDYLSSLTGGSSSDAKEAATTTAKDAATTALTNIVSGLAGTVYSAPVSLNGNYTYQGSAVSVSSSEGGIVSNLAGTAVASGIESKVDQALAKVGVKPGITTFNFNNEDNTFTCTVMGIPLGGKYKVGDGENTVTLTFGKTINYLCMTGNLKSSLNGCEMLFPANKMLSFLKKVAAIAGEKSSEVAAIKSLADGYDQFKVGMKLVK